MGNRAELGSTYYGRDGKTKQGQGKEADSSQCDKGSAVTAISTAVFTFREEKNVKMKN